MPHAVRRAWPAPPWAHAIARRRMRRWRAQHRRANSDRQTVRRALVEPRALMPNDATIRAEVCAGYCNFRGPSSLSGPRPCEGALLERLRQSSRSRPKDNRDEGGEDSSLHRNSLTGRLHPRQMKREIHPRFRGHDPAYVIATSLRDIVPVTAGRGALYRSDSPPCLRHTLKTRAIGRSGARSVPFPRRYRSAKYLARPRCS